jgi:Rieske Fe-S protein
MARETLIVSEDKGNRRDFLYVATAGTGAVIGGAAVWPMINQMNAALQAGALGAKIIGSGGGGAMVAIAEEHTKENIIQAFKTVGAHDAYEVKLAIH